MYLQFPKLHILLLALLSLTNANPILPRAPSSESSPTCRKTKVAILGAGVAGITAAQALHNTSISDFLIIDVNDYIGGRLKHTTFGKNSKTGKPYTVELGANWVQGLGTPGGPENPIWTLAKKWDLQNTYSDYSAIQTYDENGLNDYSSLLDEYQSKFTAMSEDAGTIVKQNLQDHSARAGLSTAGWKPMRNDMHRQAAEWWQFDWEYCNSPEQSSETFAVVNFNSSFNQWSDANNFVLDPRGFNAFIALEASTFLTPNDTRLLLNTNITAIDYTSSDSITITTRSGACITASYAIVTFSLGVLQNDLVSFTPELPAWKRAAIDAMSMGTYTKIFLQFPPGADGTFFWERTNASTQFFLYADPVSRGFYPVWQSLSAPGFLPGSGILFVTVVSAQAYVVENQPDAVTRTQVLAVLRAMFGADNVPEPTDFLLPRWSREAWAMGSYSNWPPGVSLEVHQGLRANLGKLWFAGEAGSVEYFGFLQGAYYEGLNAGATIAGCILGNKTVCQNEPHYETVRGCTTSERMLKPENGWNGATFQTFGV